MPEDRLLGAHAPDSTLTGRRSATSSSAGRRGAARARRRRAATAPSSLERDRRLGALDHGDDLGSVGERARPSSTRVDPAPPQATISLAGEADRVAAAEAALGVVARGRGDGADADRRRARRSAARRSPRRRPSARTRPAPRAPPAASSMARRRRVLRRPAAPPPRRPSARSASSAARRPRSAGHARSPASRSLVDGLRVGPPSTTVRAEPARTARRMPSPAATATTAGPPAPRAAPAALATCSCMSAMSSLLRPSPSSVEQRLRRVGVVGVDVDLERRLVADDEDRVAELLEPRRRTASPSRPVAGDDEVGAVAVAASRRGGPGRAARARSGGSRAAATCSPASPATIPRMITTRPSAPASTTPASAQHLELLRRAAHRLLAGEQRRRRASRRAARSARRRSRRGRARSPLPVREPLGDRVGHRRGSRSASSPRRARGPRRRRRRRRA